jgi:multisubunit Na+/H+ antiporter MnhF subunit
MNNNFSETSDYMTEPVKQITNNINDNQMLTYGLSFLFILYAFVASPTIPDNIANLFNNPLFKLSILHAIFVYELVYGKIVITFYFLQIKQRFVAFRVTCCIKKLYTIKKSHTRAK